MGSKQQDRFSVSVESGAFDPEAEAARLRRGNPVIGGQVSFVGLMRDLNDGRAVSRMTLEHYPGMTEGALDAILREACERWELEAGRIVHRVGELLPEEPIVLVSVASRHRGDAFRACEFIIDYLKTRAPFWKREDTADGSRWVEARQSDSDAEARWRNR